MRTIVVGSLLILILFLSGCSGEGPITPAAVFSIPEPISDQGAIALYFCPQGPCEQELVQFLHSAQHSIHCAFYDIGLKSVQETLREKQAKIEVQVVTDNDYLKKFNYSFVKADSYGLMHDKFCIIDGRKISTGSMNPTDNDAHKNNNNLLLIESRVIAQNYEDEFQEMWNGNFKKGAKVQNPAVLLNQQGKEIRVQTYFCPEDHCAEHVREELKKAEKTIHFMTFSFTHDGIANILLLKNLDGVEVKGVMEVKQISQFSVFDRLSQNKIEVRKDGNKNNLHHKVFIIDGKTVVTGSFNPTANGDEHNDENVIIIEDAEIAHLFEQEFEKVYAEGND
ncbi:MAG TPA: phospholipase D-like domain-containing protein [Candidatus Nanoarchaeia archaeon]|nr:phospholipase D-like domain-containing protein [Candidatus Nanoarchaeia archaeon]